MVIGAVTGASFAIFNGALKHSSGLTAKCSIVEDGVMVQVLPKTMAAIKQSLKDMTDMTIPCGYSTGSDPQSCVCVCWVDDDRKVNVGSVADVLGGGVEWSCCRDLIVWPRCSVCRHRVIDGCVVTLLTCSCWVSVATGMILCVLRLLW